MINNIKQYLKYILPPIIVVLLFTFVLSFKSCDYRDKIDKMLYEYVLQQKTIDEIEKNHKIIDNNNKIYPEINNQIKNINKEIDNNNNKLSNIKQINKKDIEDEIEKTNINDLSHKFSELGYDNSITSK